MRGASRGVLEVEQVRRPRACLASTHSGGAGAPPGTTRGACQELAYYPGPKCPEGRAARRRNENAAMERREAPASFKRGCGKTERLVRRSVLHPLDLSRGTTRPASRGRLFECWISGRPDIQSGRTRRPCKEYGRPRAPFCQRIRAMAQRLLGPRFRGDDRGETIADPRISANREP